MTEKPQSHITFHYAWIIMICCFFLYGLSQGAFANTIGLFNAAIAEDFGWSISKVSVCTVFVGLASAVTLIVVDRVYKKYDVRLVLCLSQGLFALTTALRGLCSQMWQFSLVYIVCGITTAFLWYVPIPMLIRNWFKKWTGLALSVSLCSGGVVGIILNPILSGMIEKNGWRYTTIFLGIIMALLTLPLIAFFVRKKPEELGFTAYGEDICTKAPEAHLDTADDAPDIPGKEKEHEGSFGWAELATPGIRRCFIYSMIVAFIACLISTIPQQFAHLASVEGLGASTGALLVSVSMAGNMIGKITIGPASDLFGKKKTFLVSYCAVIAGFVLMALFSSKAGVLLFAGAFLVGVSAPNSGVVTPLLVAEYSEGDMYTFFVSKVTIAVMIAYAFGSYVGAGLYDMTGSYLVPFIVYAALGVLALFFILRILAVSGSRKSS